MAVAVRLLFAATLLVPPCASAMHFYADPPFLHLQGRVEATDWRVWRQAMELYEGRIDTIVFHNSPGGDSNTGRNIGKTIRKLGLRTVVAGRCISACANMFLGGKERYFSARMNEQPTVLGYHGSYNKRTGEVNKTRSGDYFMEMSDGKMSEELIERFIRIEQRRGALYFIHPSQVPKGEQKLSYFCQGEEDAAHRDEQCEKLPIDALEVGVVTTWDAVVAPPVPRRRPNVSTSKNWD